MNALVPALAEMHEAHKARRARMEGRAAPKPAAGPIDDPAPVLKPPQRLYRPIGTTAQKVEILAAAGYANWRIAKRLGVTEGVVAGIIYRSRSRDHRLLMMDVCAILFGMGFDTVEIGQLVDEPEHVIYKLLWRRLNDQRAGA